MFVIFGIIQKLRVFLVGSDLDDEDDPFDEDDFVADDTYWADVKEEALDEVHTKFYPHDEFDISCHTAERNSEDIPVEENSEIKPFEFMNTITSI